MTRLVAFGLLSLAVVAILALTTPWQPLRGPVPGGRVAADARRDFTAEEIAREQAYHRAVRPPAFASLAVGLAVAGILGLTPLGGRLVTGVGRGSWLAQAAFGGLALALVPKLVTLPFDVAAENVLRRYGLSTQSWTGWAADQAKGALVGGVVLLVALVGLLALARRMPRGWWVPAGLGATALVCLASYVYPVVVEPLFNRFTPLPPGTLRTELLDLARRDGVPVTDVLVADASRRTTALNAYVSGYGRTRRIVVYDTLLASAPKEVELVVAHELGHVKHHDVRNGTLIGALGAAAAVAGLALLLDSAAVLKRLGASGPGDPRVAGFVLFAIAATSFLLAPAENLVSRRIEARADVHALDLTRDPDTFVASEHRLAVTNLSDLHPNRVIYALFFTHPSSPERIALARSWARREHAG